MRYTSLHKVITGYLLQKRYPIHFYVEFLIYANRCLQELHFDTLGNVRVKKLPINEYGAVALPCDFMDWCKISVPIGEYTKPLANRPGLSRLNAFDSNGDKVAYSSVDTEVGTFNALFSNGWNTVRWNDKLESTGRGYGSRGDQTNTFKVLLERNEIQVNSDIKATEIILEYISDGQESDNATRITPYAIATIEAYINWKYKENARSYSETERSRAQREFDHQYRILRARKNSLTIADIKAIINRNSHGGLK